jgi:hypothetical protein
MQPGDCFTIEPSIEQLHVGPDGEVGGGDIWKDGWTVVTKVGRPFRELTPLVGPDGSTQRAIRAPDPHYRPVRRGLDSMSHC